jgi:hypothetical protein
MDSRGSAGGIAAEGGPGHELEAESGVKTVATRMVELYRRGRKEGD